MADFTYQTRKKWTEDWIKALKKRGAGLSAREKSLLPTMALYAIPQETREWMQSQLREGKCKTLSEIYRKHFSGLVAICVGTEKEEEFYYALDQMNQFQMTAGWLRRSVRCGSYEPFAGQSVQLLRAYARIQYYGARLSDILIGRVEAEIYDHARTESWSYAGMLAAQIDAGDRETIQAVEDILLGEGNTAMISYELIRGIVMSKSEALYGLLGRFLLAARLQEGARQAVCETMDAGRPEAFLSLFCVIEENNLIRYSSVKRAVSTWIGIFDEKNVDRITDKLVRLMGRCLRDTSAREEALGSNDSVALSCALWAIGFYDAEEAVRAVQKLVHSGTKNQRMTASYFNRSLQLGSLKMKAAKEVILSMPEDMELAACFMPGFMDSAHSVLYSLARGGRSGYYSLRDAKPEKPAQVPVTDFFDSRTEAETAYERLWSLYRQLPKKGILLKPCIFPWYQVELTQSDVAVRLCLLAWMLQNAEYLDETARLIPLIGQGNTYGAASRAAAARVLLYRPESEARKAVLFELLHNPEEYTLQSAFSLAEYMELSPDDYLQIEKNLKYKKGRAGTLSLLRKQEKPQLLACIGRLLSEKSEECHMGALDLALQIKKEDPSSFEKVRPLLSVLTAPTGREEVLLGELLGENSEAQDILNTPGYGFYNPQKEWVLPPVTVDEKQASGLFVRGEGACMTALDRLNALIEREKDREYTTAWGAEVLLGTKLENCRWIHGDSNLEPLDALPFREMWEKYYETEIQTPEFLVELYLYQQCRAGRSAYETNKDLYKKVFGSGLLKKAPFQNLAEGLRYGNQARKVIDTLFSQYVPDSVKARWGLIGTAKLMTVLNEKNALYEVTETRWNGAKEIYTRRAVELPLFESLRWWLSAASEEDWGSAFTLRFRMQEFYAGLKDKEKKQRYGSSGCYLQLQDFVQAYVKGVWDKDLFYKGVFTYLKPGDLLASVSTVMQQGAVLSRKVRPVDLKRFFGMNVIRPVDGKYHFDTIGEEMPAMTLAREIYAQMVPAMVKVELKRGEQPTPFSESISSIRVVYGIDVMIQILTALGKDTLERSSGYYLKPSERRAVLSHLLKVCCPNPEETAQDLKKALKGTDITKKRLTEMAMYAQQWIPLLEEYLALPGFTSGCYYFMAHTSERMDEFITSMVAKYTPLSPEELRDGAFDLNWFFEAYGKLGEKNFKLLYDAAKYSSAGAAHARARKYADAALGKVTKEELKTEIQAKRNKDLLMSLGLLPLPESGREAELLDRYQFIQKFKKESKAFGAQRRASEGRAVDLALRNLSVNAGFTDVTRLILQMETKLSESISGQFEWQLLDEAEQVSLRILTDGAGKSSLQIRRGEKLLKSIPAKYKKHEMVLEYQENNKKLKEQYSRTRQMLEQAMEDRTAFEAWELSELEKSPVVGSVVRPLVLRLAECGDRDAAQRTDSDPSSIKLGFLKDGCLVSWNGEIVTLKPETRLYIAHPIDLYQEGHWHEYQKLLFEKQERQAFKQVFRELYVKLSEELEKDESLMFSGNQIQPQKTVGTLRGRRWVADYEDGLQKIYYKENIVARIYAMADWFSPSDVEAPTLEWVVFTDRKTFKPLKIKDIPDIIYSEVMRDVDLAVSTAHAGGVDPETSHSTVEMRKAIAECTLELFKLQNVKLEGNHALIDGKLGRYSVHLGSGVVHQMGNAMLYVLPVHSQHRGRLFLPFLDEDPKTAEIISKILLFAEDGKIKDPSILSQIR